MDNKLSYQKVAQHAALDLGKPHLYEISKKLSEKQARPIVTLAQRNVPDPDPTLDLDLNMTDDEDFIDQLKEMAENQLVTKHPRELNAFDFDPYDSYFSEEDEEVLKNDDLKRD